MNNLNRKGIDAFRKARGIGIQDDKIKGRVDYSYVDSHLDGKDEFGDWCEGSLFNNFYSVIEGEKSLKKYIENILQEKEGMAIGVEFGGLGINLFKDFTLGFFGQSIGVSLSDYRTDDGQLYGNKQRTYKDGRQHNIIIGNLFDAEVYKNIEKVIGNKKVDLIIERMYAGLDNVPDNYLVVMTILQKWYSMLDKGGLMLVEAPVFAVEVIKKWVEKLKTEKYAKQVDVEFDELRMALRIHKLSNIPSQLPKLTLKEIKNNF